MPSTATARYRCRTLSGSRVSSGPASNRRGRRLGAPRQRTVDHVDGVLQTVDRNERTKARTFLLAQQHLIEQIEPVERNARFAVLRLFLLVQERLATADLVDHILDILRARGGSQLRERVAQIDQRCALGIR